MKRARILLALNRASSLAAHRKLLEQEFDVVGVASDYRTLLAKGLKSEPDMIVGDLELPLWSEPDLRRKLEQLIPKTKVLLVSVGNDASAGPGSPKTRASGLTIKRSTGTNLVDVLQEFLDEQPDKTAETNPATSYPFAPAHDVSKELTQRQREVLKLLAEGRTMKQTGEILNLTTRTIAFHKYKIMRDFELHNNLELLRLAIREHLVSPD
jgi:DNA-binding NarL/FixJ family response regulator